MTERQPSALGWVGGGVATLACVAVTAFFAARNGHGGPALIGAELALAMLLLPYFLLGAERPARWVAGLLRNQPLRIAVAAVSLPAAYVVYGVGTDTFWGVSLLKLTLYVAVATSLAVWASLAGRPVRWQDGAAILALWIPMEAGLLDDLWSWPPGAGFQPMGVILAVVLAVLLFDSFRGLPGVGYRFAVRRSDLRPVVVNFLAFVAIGIPIGLATGFLTWSPDVSGPIPFLGRGIGIFLLTAIPEELLFRGLIQNVLQRWLKRTWPALLLAALIFGAAHLENGPFPDWRYFVLATIAGVFYGRAYLKTGSLMAPALVHALVDLTWAELFS
jgi:membrane protease YdiL (CAAX protease family)